MSSTTVRDDFVGVDFESGYNNNLMWLLRNTVPLYYTGLTTTKPIENIENVFDEEDEITHFKSEINQEFYDFLSEEYPQDIENGESNITVTHIRFKMPVKLIKKQRYNVDHFIVTLDGLYSHMLSAGTNLFVKHTDGDQINWFRGIINFRTVPTICIKEIEEDIDKNETYFKFYIPGFLPSVDIQTLNPENIELFTDFNAVIYGYNGFKLSFNYYEEDSKYYIQVPVDKEYVFAEDWEPELSNATFHFKHKIYNQTLMNFFNENGNLILNNESNMGNSRKENILLIATKNHRADPKVNANVGRTTNAIYKNIGNIVNVETLLLVPKERVGDATHLEVNNSIHETTNQWANVISKCLTAYGDGNYLDAMSNALSTTTYQEKDYYVIETTFQFVVSNSSISQRLFERSSKIDSYTGTINSYNPNYC